MNDTPALGLWLPRRASLDDPMDPDHPAIIDTRICDYLYQYLDESGITYIDNLDFRKAIIKNNEVILGDVCLTDLDQFVWMGYLDRTMESYDLEVLGVMEREVKVHNSRTFYSVATDKFSALNKLYHHGIPTSEHFLVNLNNVDYLKPLFEHSSFLLKPRRSSFGLGIIKIDRFSQLRDIMEFHPKKSYHLEKFYPNDMEAWTGVTVINGVPLYGYRKKMEKISDWKVYDRGKSGGKINYVELSPELKKISAIVGEILEGNIYGLDFIKTEEGYKIVDVNCHPGIYYEFIKELNIPIAEIFFKMLDVPQLA